MKVKTILVSQPEPKIENSPYFDLQEKQKVKIDFRPFIHVEGVPAKDIRQQKVDLNNYTAIILTSRNSVDHFFRVAEEMRFKVPDTMKYFCQSEAVAFYLQKYVVYRKRKIFFAGQKIDELADILKKHKKELYLFISTSHPLLYCGAIKSKSQYPPYSIPYQPLSSKNALATILSYVSS